MSPAGRLSERVHALAGRFSMGYERRALTMLLLVLALDFAERALLGAIGPTLQQAFHIGNSDLGLLAGALAVVGALGTVPVGLLADRVDRTRVLAISLLLWSAAVGATGGALSFAMLFVAQLCVGVVAATAGPTLPSLIGDLVPANRRAHEFGYVDSGQLVGEGIGYVLPIVILTFLSFRWTFWVLGIASVALALGFWRLGEPERTGASGPKAEDGRGEHEESKECGKGNQVRKIVREQDVTPSQRAMLRQDPGAMSLWNAARYVLSVRTDVIVLVGRSIGDYFFAGIGTFAVVFATKQYNITGRQADLAVLGVGIGALAGVLLIGRIADGQLRRGRLNSRIWLGAIGYVVAPFALAPAFVTHSLLIAMPSYVVGAFLLGGANPPLDAVRIDVIVPRLRGRAESVRQVVRSVAEGGAPLLIGVLSDHLAGGGQAGLQLALVVTLPLLLVNGLVLLIALRTYRPDVAAAVASSEALDRRRQHGAP